MHRGSFTGSLQAIRFGNAIISHVASTRCLGVEIDSNLKWSKHVSELIKTFVQKLNLLKSFGFLPINTRLDFYFKVILSSITYVLIIQSSCNKTLFEEIEWIHVRVAKIIYCLDWCTPKLEVLSTANCIPLRHLYYQRLLFLAHDCFYGASSTPLHDLFVKCESSYILRKKLCFNIPRPKTNLLLNSIAYVGAKL